MTKVHMARLSAIQGAPQEEKRARGRLMADFSDREKGYERDFERKQELAFKVKARRNHLLGLWAAGQMGLAGEAAETYARGIADPAQHLRGDKDIIAKIVGDFKAKAVALDATRVALELEHFAAQAEKQVG
jgi:hypothetical protein